MPRLSSPPAPMRTSAPLVGLLLLAAVAAALPGCSGCWRDPASAGAKKKEEDEEAKRRKKLEKPKEDFEPLALRLLPSNDPSPLRRNPEPTVKPGHWTGVQVLAKANNFDFPGDLTVFVEQLPANVPVEVENTTSRVWSWCPAVLAKGQTKRIESLFYVPRQSEERGKIYSLRTELRSARGGRMEAFASLPCPSLKDYEHQIVVLAGGSVSPASYSFFGRLLSVRAPQVEATENEALQYYRVVTPVVERSVPLPSYALAWTTIAYVFWDDLPPEVLTSPQQQALLDWLHWGGQLVISGPSTLDRLKGSFLEPYLPAEAVETVKLEEAAFAEMNTRFSLPRRMWRAGESPETAKGENLRRIRVLEEQPMVGVAVKLHPAASEISGTGGLVIERRVGGGRVVVTRFPLTDVRIKNWKNFDGFFNAVLLRRPPRIFAQDDLGLLQFRWAVAGLEQMKLEARLGSTLRYFTRDIGFLPDDPRSTELIAEPRTGGSVPPPARRRAPGSGAPVYGAPGMGFAPFNPPESSRARLDTTTTEPALDDWHFGGYHASLTSGVAAWNDSGAAAEAARKALREAAGIQIPRASFVLQVLAVYLLVLVPVNWFVFWLLGRVEWAWVAAPLIALGGAAAVIRLAQLDIGFARSRTEIAVLEIQGGYERAHVTRYTALYSSLSSDYTLAFEEPSSLALPFAAGPRNESLLAISNYQDVAFRRDKVTSLAGVQVSSNSTGLVHSEQMAALGTSPKVTESLVLVGDETGSFSVRNTTDLPLFDVGVFRRRESRGADGRMEIETAYLAKLEPATSARLRFAPLAVTPRETDEQDPERSLAARSYPPVWLAPWDQSPAFSPDGENDNKGRVRLRLLAQLATQRLRLLPGDVRLVAWTDHTLPGMQITPAAPQNTAYTLVLAHLARGRLPPVAPDKNVAEDYSDLLEPLEPGEEPVEGM